MVDLPLTIVCPLESSRTKNERLRPFIEHQREIRGYLADILPGIPAHQQTIRDSQTRYRIGDEYGTENSRYPVDEGTYMYAHDAYQATREKVFGAFESWRSNAHDEKRPSFGDGAYFGFCSCGSCDERVSFHENDRGYGVNVEIESRGDPLWFHARAGGYQAEYFERLIDGDLRYGNAEIHLDGETPVLHLTVVMEVEMPDSGNIETIVGVDLGQNVLYAATARCPETGEIRAVDERPGGEFYHHRALLQRKKKRLQQQGKRREMLELGHQRERHAKQELDTASREIVAFARQHKPCRIHLEELTGLREQKENHTFPYAMIHEMIVYKAKKAGIPVKTVDAHHTSETCPKCGNTDGDQRHWNNEFHCLECGYQNQSADVTAAMNIAADINA